MMIESNYLESLYVPKAYRKEYDELSFELLINGFGRATKEYSFKRNIPIIVIYTKGTGKRESFHGYQEAFADFGKIGDSIGEAYVYTDNGKIGYPRRFGIYKDRLLIDLREERKNSK